MLLERRGEGTKSNGVRPGAVLLGKSGVGAGFRFDVKLWLLVLVKLVDELFLCAPLITHGDHPGVCNVACFFVSCRLMVWGCLDQMSVIA